jgi:hypothetical protein
LIDCESNADLSRTRHAHIGSRNFYSAVHFEGLRCRVA